MGKVSGRVLISAVLLANGRPAWPVAKALGIPSAVFARRIKLGMSPDMAAKTPVGGPVCGGYGSGPSSDPVEQAIYDSRVGFALARVAARLAAVVVATDGDLRLAVSGNGSCYMVQSRVGGDGVWGADCSFVGAGPLALHVEQSPKLSAVAAALPDEPALWLAMRKAAGNTKQ